jgi:hypothetical protein
MSLTEVHVCYDAERPGMFIRVTGEPMDEFVSSSTWRVWMYYAAEMAAGENGDSVFFDGSLGLRECQEILESIKDGEGHGAHVLVDPSFEEYVAQNESYIEARSHAGLAIKGKTLEEVMADPTLGPRFVEFRDVVNSSMVRPLRDRQMLDAFFMAVVGHAADFSVPGSGKTAAVLGVFAYLRHLGKVRRIVVVCPKSGFESWEREWKASFGGKTPLKLFCLGDPLVESMPLARRKRALEFDSGADNLIVLNYESLSNYVGELEGIVPDQTLLVFDEAHRIKAIRGKRAGSALKVAKNAKFVIALTGTPIPNTYQDVYNLLHILFPVDYDTFFGYSPDELKDPSDGLKDAVNKSMRPFFCRTSKDDLGVPRPDPDMIVDVEARNSENELLRILYGTCKSALALIVRTLQLESDPLLLSEAISEEDLKYVLDQVSDDFADIDYVDFSSEYPGLIESSRPSSKLVRCEELVKSIVAQGSPVIVWCIFVRSIRDLVHDLNDMGIPTTAVYGAVPQSDRSNILDEFREGRYKVLVSNPQTLAESVSLHTVCHDAVYFEYSYNLVHLLQSKDRIHRLGLPQEQRTRYYFLRETFMRNGAQFSLDEKIYERLSEKEQTMLRAIEGGYLEEGYLDQEDARIIFEELLGDDASSLRY